MDVPIIISNTYHSSNDLTEGVFDLRMTITSLFGHYTEDDLYYTINPPKEKQRWFFYISSAKTFINNLLITLLHSMMKETETLSVIKNMELASLNLNGNLGYNQIGKIFKLIPKDNINLDDYLAKLIKLCSGVFGPKVTDSFKLSDSIYIKYGAYNPITTLNKQGIPTQYYIDEEGNFVEDTISIRGSIPQRAIWPFHTLKYTAEKKNTLLNSKYYPVRTVKKDPKGKVLYCIYLQTFFRLKSCIIKQGRENMALDNSNRSIVNRLKWQVEVMSGLSDKSFVPALLPTFMQNGNYYVPMERLKGRSLLDEVNHVYNYHPWNLLSLHQRQRLIDLLINVFKIVKTLHHNNIVHRDLTPANFFVSRDRQLYLLDFELSYSLQAQEPNPPFGLGTFGFMSPEQQNYDVPTTREDIYALGGIMIFILTGFLPGKYFPYDIASLEQRIQKFIPDKNLATLILSCYAVMPEERPTLETLADPKNYTPLLVDSLPYKQEKNTTFSTTQLNELIQRAINGLSFQESINSDGNWISNLSITDQDFGIKIEGKINDNSLGYSSAGILKLILKAKAYGYDLQTVSTTFVNSFASALNALTTSLEPGGLMIGSAGISLAVFEAVQKGYFQIDSELSLQNNVLAPSIATNLGLGTGAAGQGVALIELLRYTSNIPNLTHKILERIDTIYKLIEASIFGNKFTRDSPKKSFESISVFQGLAGKVIFLIKYYQLTKNGHVLEQIRQSIELIPDFTDERYLTKRVGKLHQSEYLSTLHGVVGLALTMILAYSVDKNERYSKKAEKILRQIPLDLQIAELSTENGLSGIGSTYLLALRYFQDEEWLTRANKILQTIINLEYRPDNPKSIWRVSNDPIVYADIFMGTGGIIWFLLNRSDYMSATFPLITID